MTAIVEINGQTGRLLLSGQFDFSAHRDFRQACDELLGSEAVREILIDFGQVDYLDSSALGMLLLLKEKAAGRQLALINCRDTVRQVLEIACFGKIFTIR
ncbi:STAS domain-containing protein [Chitinimonas sp. BJYL2]|uniref:STAS domain-containing protein n=1 Tax=Chitinimonas sp. BJYL2 TaxID=2976696 RepID=UPI0022B50FF1|nr:STAS domain-containing protein [Chitinimonas sp. BJYL2]